MRPLFLAWWLLVRPLFLAWWLLMRPLFLVWCEVAPGANPVSGVVASEATPVSGVVASVKLAVVVAPIAPYDFVPGTDKDSSTRQSSLSHGDLDAQRDDFGSFQRNFKLKPFHVSRGSSKEPCSQTFKRRARPNARQRRAARRRQMTSDVDEDGLGVVSLVSDMGQSPQGVSKKRNRPNARQRRHRRAARSPVRLLSRAFPFVHLVEWLFAWRPCRNSLDSQQRTQISARCGSPEISLV